MAKYESSVRQETYDALEYFKEHFNTYPISMANHSQCIDNIYWGSYRLTGINRLIYDVITFGKYSSKFKGHQNDSKYFWGDYCQEKIKYVRNFVFSDINTLKMCPFMPYHDEKKPFVNYWFASSNGHNVTAFNKLISESNQDRLVELGGACVVYTHFADGFIENGVLNDTFKFLIKRLSEKSGWFVPVSKLLDYLKKENADHIISNKQRFTLEFSWLKDQIVQKIS